MTATLPPAPDIETAWTRAMDAAEALGLREATQAHTDFVIAEIDRMMGWQRPPAICAEPARAGRIAQAAAALFPWLRTGAAVAGVIGYLWIGAVIVNALVPLP